jgi:F-type H+-transporting ATPase subunit epsilon
MSATFLLEVATPERLMLREAVIAAEIPAADGYVGILPGHAPLLSELGAGVLTFTKEGGAQKSMAISGGWLEVQPEHVRVLASASEFGGDIDIARAQASLKRAEDRLATPPLSLDVARALNSMRRAEARLRAARDVGHGK